MLIESAFFKLPELLLSNSDHGSEVESTIVHLFASALQMEMNARNIPRPFASFPRNGKVLPPGLNMDDIFSGSWIPLRRSQSVKSCSQQSFRWATMTCRWKRKAYLSTQLCGPCYSNPAPKT